MVIIGSLFFIFGFITWINGTLIPYLKIACELRSDFQSYLVATAFFIAYTVMAIPASLLLRNAVIEAMKRSNNKNSVVSSVPS